MKKRLVSILLIIIISMCVCASSFAEGLELLVWGDADGDEKLTVSDVVAIQLYSAGLKEISPEHVNAADLDLDGAAGISDAAIIQQLCAKITSLFPELKNASVELGIGETYQIPLKNGNQAFNNHITYAVSGVAVSVDENGCITAENEGASSVVCTNRLSNSSTLGVTVMKAPEKLELNYSEYSLKKGEKLELDIRINQGAAANVRNYTSSDESIAVVNEDGVVTAKKSGNAVITCTIYNGLSASCNITVPDEPGYISTATEIDPFGTQPAADLPYEYDSTIGDITSIEKTSFETGRIVLSWNQADGATGYFVHICNADVSNTYTLLADVNTTSCIAFDLADTTQYHFMITPYKLSQDKITIGNSVVKKTATQPAAVTYVSKICTSSVITIGWDIVPKATGYKVYRMSSETNGEYELYFEIKGNNVVRFTDHCVQDGKAYYYKVKAYRDLYNKATYHSVGKTVKCVCGLGTPEPKIQSQLRRAIISWSKNKYAHGYDIYYSSTNDGDYEKLGSTTDNYYTTSRFPQSGIGSTYYIRVVPYRLVGSSKTKVTGTYKSTPITITDKAFGTSVGTTYIEISLQNQRMWFIKDGEIIVNTSVVTGNDDGSHNTPTGIYSVYQRARNTTLTGPGYSAFVYYWMGFNGGIGIHDATWRSGFGGTIYKGNGSHGCVNTPYDAVKKIYDNTGYNTTVIVHK